MYIRLLITFVIVFFCHAGSAQQCKQAVSTDRFSINSNGTVSDKKSGLSWMRCALGQKWNGKTCEDVAQRFSLLTANVEAQFMNNNKGFAGLKNWRLPKLEELQQLIEKQCYDPAINLELFPNTPATGFWSGTPHKHYKQGTWLVYFLDGSSYMGNVQQEWAVRLVSP